MPNQQSVQTDVSRHPTKTNDCWPLAIRLEQHTTSSGRWDSIQWQIAELLPEFSEHAKFHNLLLELHLDQRTAYRFNLDSQAPCLFLLCHESDIDNAFIPIHLTASQDEASSFMDGEHQVLSTEMPFALRCWLEAYLNTHGELIDSGRKKKKSGKGRSSGN